MGVIQATPVTSAKRARPVVDLFPATKTRVAKGLPRAIGLVAPVVLLRVIPGTPAIAMRTCAVNAAEARPAIGVERPPAIGVERRPAIEVEMPPATVADTPRVIAEE
ncbi:MAG: hypothetical protein ACRD23_19560 [Terriglobales bacterium]